jgi:hypothetical protein
MSDTVDEIWGHRLFWDYYGPMAKGTAEHFLAHLKQFLEQKQLLLETGITHFNENHSFVSCESPIIHLEMLIKTLRPKRYQIIQK